MAFTPSDIDLAKHYFEAKLKLTLGPIELKELQDNPQSRERFVLIDVRHKEGYQKEHVPGAMNIPEAELSARLDEIPKDKEIIVYCWTLVCHLATRAALTLAQHGYFVRELEGGIQEWKNYEMPLESGLVASHR